MRSLTLCVAECCETMTLTMMQPVLELRSLVSRRLYCPLLDLPFNRSIVKVGNGLFDDTSLRTSRTKPRAEPFLLVCFLATVSIGILRARVDEIFHHQNLIANVIRENDRPKDPMPEVMIACFCSRLLQIAVKYQRL